MPFCAIEKKLQTFTANIYLFKVDKRRTKKGVKKLTIETPEQCH